MRQSLCFCICGLLILANPVHGHDLYRVTVKDKMAAAVLKATGVDGVVGLPDGFLVLADSAASSRLTMTGLPTQLILAAVERDELALEMVHGVRTAGQAATADEPSSIKVIRMPQGLQRSGPDQEAIVSLADEYVPIQFRESRYSAEQMLARLGGVSIPLEELISRVSRDSLESYERMLASFYPRFPGQAANNQARDWLAGKLTTFGVDSVAIDSLDVRTKYGTMPGYNVIGYKRGARFPDHHIIVGAHRDAAEVLGGGPFSPGADDDGSGTAAVLEIARILAPIETDMTVVLVLFDAEEQGLFGAKHCARTARARGDSVVCMLNLDMIGDINNSGAARMSHFQQSGVADLFCHLADSLLYLQCSDAGHAIADHFPFAQAGYETAFLEEYVFSSVYHTINDDTNHISLDYLMTMTQASLATVYAVSATAWPTPTLAFRFPYGLPSHVSPSKSTAFAVAITPVSGGMRLSGTEKLCYSVEQGDCVTVPLDPVSENLFRATIPATACGSRVRYFVQAEEAGTGVLTDVDTANGHLVIAAGSIETIFADNFETDKGWTAVGTDTRSTWERGVPSGCGFANEAVLDYDKSGQCWQTGNGWYQTSPVILQDKTELTSPSINLADRLAIAQYAVWYSNNASGYYPSYTIHQDTFKVYVTGDGVNWTLVQQIGPVVHADGGWFTYGIRLTDYIAPSVNIRMKFYAEDQGASSLVDAALDAFQVLAYDCSSQPSCCSGPAGNVNMIGIIDLADLASLVSYLTGGGYQLLCNDAANVNGFGIVDLSDLSSLVSYLTGGGYVLPSCP